MATPEKTEKKKLEGIVKLECLVCDNNITPHYYVGKVEANKTYFLYRCLYCGRKYQSSEKIIGT